MFRCICYHFQNRFNVCFLGKRGVRGQTERFDVHFGRNEVLCRSFTAAISGGEERSTQVRMQEPYLTDVMRCNTISIIQTL